MADASKTARLEAAAVAAREDLVSHVAALSSYVSPPNVAERAKSKAKAQFVDSSGALRLERVVPIAVVLVGLVVLRIRSARRR